MIIDTHAHIYDEAFRDDLEQVVERAKSAGVVKMIIPGTKPTDAVAIDKICKTYEFCYPALAIHPEDISENVEVQCKQLVAEFERHNFVAVGECGIDLHWDKSRLDDQKKVLAYQIRLANDLHLPLIFHCRDAMSELLDVVSSNLSPHSKGVFHCFTGSVDDAHKIIDMGFMLGVGGVVTFKKSDVKDVLRQVGLSNVVLETDCPYLAPVPMRGKRNEPSFLRYVVDFLADYLDLSSHDIEDVTTENALKLFNINI